MNAKGCAPCLSLVQHFLVSLIARIAGHERSGSTLGWVLPNFSTLLLTLARGPCLTSPQSRDSALDYVFAASPDKRQCSRRKSEGAGQGSQQPQWALYQLPEMPQGREHHQSGAVHPSHALFVTSSQCRLILPASGQPPSNILHTRQMPHVLLPLPAWPCVSDHAVPPGCGSGWPSQLQNPTCRADTRAWLQSLSCSAAGCPLALPDPFGRPSPL